jgi:hypothetical protein
MKRDGHCPGSARRGQFFRDARSLQKKAHRFWADKPLRENEKPVERRAAARGHHIGWAGRHRLCAGVVDCNRRCGDSRRLAQERAFAGIGLD